MWQPLPLCHRSKLRQIAHWAGQPQSRNDGGWAKDQWVRQRICGSVGSPNDRKERQKLGNNLKYRVNQQKQRINMAFKT